MSRKLGQVPPHPPFVPPVQQMFTVPLCCLVGDPEGESLAPQPQLVRGREEVQRVQSEQLDRLDAPSYWLTCVNLTLLIKIIPVLSPIQCDCAGQVKQGNSKYD